MKGKCFLTLFALCLASVVLASDYKILSMNTDNVKIGRRVCKVGDVISDESVVFWSKDKQAFKAQNVKTKEIRLFTAPEFKAKGYKTIKQCFLKTNRMSSRGPLTLEELGQQLSDTFYLLDSIQIKSPMSVDSTRRYHIIIHLGNREIEKELPCDNDTLIIERSIFTIQGMPEEFFVSVLLTNDSVGGDYRLTDTMKIVLLPYKLD